jgi:sulfur-oxidizing protein SoxY
MNQTRDPVGFTRRQLLMAVGTGGLAATTMTLVPGLVLADVGSVGEAIKALIGDASPAQGRIDLDLPQIAENGNTVPVTVSIDSPMTDDDHIKAVHIFAEGNPLPNVATFHFTPACGEATCSTRMRLAKTQNVIAIAEMSDGNIYTAKTEVKVTIGCCGG